MTGRLTITAAQLRAARALLNLDQQDLCARSDISIATLRRMEGSSGPVRGTYENVAAVVAQLEAAGVEFTNGGEPGVKMRAPVRPPAEDGAEGDRRPAASAKASDMAAQQIDKLVDPAANDEERQTRKRRLLKGPKEFRNIRGDLPKAKG